MSRCFPYPPPGYTPSRASKEALIESIKFQKEQEKTKAQKKNEKRRERKEERNEIRKEANQKTGLNSKKRKKREEGREERRRRREERNEKPDPSSNKFDFPSKNILADREHLEGSGLTEEHNQPIRLHLPSTSSESTENSSKRLGPSSSKNVIRSHGTIIRIQLSSKKQNLTDISINEQQLCSTSGRTDIPLLRNQQPNFCASTEKTSDFNRTVEKQIIPTSGKSQPTAPAKTGTPPGLDAIVDSKKNTKSIQYENLIENWVPPSRLDAPCSPEDLDWLICNIDGLRPERTRRFENDSVFCSSGASLLQPRAQLFAGLDVYALPFTVPY